MIFFPLSCSLTFSDSTISSRFFASTHAVLVQRALVDAIQGLQTTLAGLAKGQAELDAGQEALTQRFDDAG